MNIDGKHYRTIWMHGDAVRIIDQTRLPFELIEVRLDSLDEVARAISEMWVRGAPLIGAAATYGVAVHLRSDPSDAGLEHACAVLRATRPTGMNLHWAIERARAALTRVPPGERAECAFEFAARVCDEDVATNEAIGQHGLALIEQVAARSPGRAVNILTHCNAGWLATVDWGTATAPIYKAHDAGIPVHVWVDETRPRSQGASLTAYELGHHGVPHTVVVDGASGHLMQHGKVDLCIVGTDRTTASGDVCNKIGTYLVALAAHDNGVPFHVALPSSTVDWTMSDGVAEIPIEQRDPAEVTDRRGRTEDGRMETVRVVASGSPAANFAFDVTPARMVTSLITEQGVVDASRPGLAPLRPVSSAA